MNRFLVFLSLKIAPLNTILYPNFNTVSLSVAPFLKDWPFQEFEILW